MFSAQIAGGWDLKDADEASAFEDDALWSAASKAIAYRKTIDSKPQRAAAGYRQMVETLDCPLPQDGMAAPAVIAELAASAEPGLNAMTGARFFGWVMGGSHPLGVAADWLTSAWGQNCGNHHAAPAAAAFEEVAAKWLLEILDLPRESSVGFVTGATSANFVCLAAARHALLARLGWNVETQGLFGAPYINVLVGADAHATVFKALAFLGLGSERVIRLATDDAGRIRVDPFLEALDRADGPTIVVAQAGQINTGAFDPFPDITKACACRDDVWLHVDGAFGLWARASGEHVDLAKGVDSADSWATDGHKWLQVPFDSGYAIVKDSAAHRAAMSLSASYLPESTSEERNPTDLVPELSRRARGFPTWAMIRHLGRDGIADMVARHCRTARRMAQRFEAEPGIEILNDVELNQIIVRFGSGADCRSKVDDGQTSDGLTRAVIDQVQADGICFAGGASWRGRWIMRLSCISFATTDEDADRSVDAIIGAWRSIRPTTDGGGKGASGRMKLAYMSAT
ncbi:MAG: pyridoxal phosphate-dependent decarboxylase family protein [Geminicoccaceae bacterium]